MSEIAGIPASETPVPIHANGLADENAGERQQHRGFKPPSSPIAGALNKEMAEAAAKKYEKDKKKIRKACAELEPEGATKNRTGCSCVIL